MVKARTKFPTKKQMASIRVLNSYNLAETIPNPIYVAFLPGSSGRAGQYARYQVVRQGYSTDPKAHWTDNGHKTFVVGNDKAATAAEAIAWTNNRYGDRVWIRDPWGSYQDGRTVDAVWALIDA